MANAERVWQWFHVIEDLGGWEEYDEPLRRALTEIEHIDGLPDTFVVNYIKRKDGRGYVIEYEGAGLCEQAVRRITRRCEEATLDIMSVAEGE